MKKRGAPSKGPRARSVVIPVRFTPTEAAAIVSKKGANEESRAQAMSLWLHDHILASIGFVDEKQESNDGSS